MATPLPPLGTQAAGAQVQVLRGLGLALGQLAVVRVDLQQLEPGGGWSCPYQKPHPF